MNVHRSTTNRDAGRPRSLARACLVLVLASCVSCAGLHGQSTAQVGATEVHHPRLDSIARSLVGEEVPGMAVLLVHDGAVLHRAAYGVTVSGGGEPVDLDTPFYIASTGKMFTTAAVLTLVEEAVLELDDPIGAHLPDVPDYASGVTVAQLLTHTSGLIDHYDVGGEGRTYSNAQVLEILRGAEGLLFEPGSRASYSNSGYVLLALLVEAVSGQAFGDFLEHRFFEPLGMDDAFVVVDAARRPADRAIGHHRGEAGFTELDYGSTTTGAGGVYASLSDLELWFRALRDGRVLGEASLALASRPPELSGGGLTPYGMGWLAEFAARGPLADRWYVLAFGSLRGHRAAFKWFQEDDLALVWLTNSDSPAPIDAFHPVPERVLTGTW